jgi:ADP-heptose:LPS heptosyltransferase
VKILCLQLKRIGDLLLTTSALTALKDAYPNAEIHVAVDGAFASLFPCLPAHRILPLRRGTIGAWLTLLRERYAVCLDFNASDRSSLASFLVRSPCKVTYARFAKRPFRRIIYHTFVNSILSERHTADFHMDLLSALGIHREGLPLSIKLPLKAMDSVDRILTSLGVAPSPFIVFHPGTLRPEKYWSNERWLEVIRHIRQIHPLPILLTGSPSQSEQLRLQSLLAHSHEGLWHDLTGKLNLAELAALISKARMLCGVDSAPIHLADALSTPCVALFGPTNPYQWRPRNPISRVVGPHSIPYRPQDPGAAMDAITVEEVTLAIDDLLQNHPFQMAR